MRIARIWASAALAAIAVMTAVAPAWAEDPPTLTSQITDTVGVLTLTQTQQVQSALDELADQTPYRLYVVYVADFADYEGLTWAEDTATESGLGPQDFLLAVAVEAHEFSVTPASSTDITTAEVESIGAHVADALHSADSDGDWSEAAVIAATDLQAAATGSIATTPSSGGGSWGTVVLIVLAIGATVGLFLVFRQKKPAGGTAGELPTAVLNTRSAQALVAIDDALRASEQELGFAQAQFGQDQTEQFAAVLTHGKQAVTEAFRLRQTLDDDVPDTDEQIRQTALRILQLCDQTAQELDAQKEAFDQLRALEANVDTALVSMARSAAEHRNRVEPATVTLSTLAARYPAQALASVGQNADQAARLLDEVERTIALGQAAVSQGDRRTAVGYARAAEQALSQIDTLLDAIDTAGTDLAQATSRLQNAVASISADLADASQLAAGDPAVDMLTGEARAAIAEAQTAAAGTGDPLAALNRIAAAEAAVDAALAPRRAAAERDRRTRQAVAQVLGRVQSAIQANNDYIATRRGVVGPQARTRVAEAERLAAQAHSRMSSEPDAAFADAQRAGALVADAQRLAQADVDRAERSSRSDSGAMFLAGIMVGSDHRSSSGFGGGFGGGFSGGHHHGGSHSSSRRGGVGGSFGGGHRGGVSGKF